MMQLQKKISMEDMQLLSAAERITGAKIADVMHTDTGLLFMVEKGELGKAIGRNGANLARLEGATKKQVSFAEEAENAQAFLKSFFSPLSIQLQEKGTGIFIRVSPQDRGLAIGRNGERIKKAKMLVQRYFGFDDVRVL